MKEKITKNTSGITLIALVVTIVILLILAGVTINLLFSENGIIKKAQNAGNSWNEGVRKDQNAINGLTDILESLDQNSLAAHVKVGDYVAYNPYEGVTDEDLLTYTSKRGNYVAKNADGTYIVAEGAEFANKDTEFADYSNYDSNGFLYNKAYEIIDKDGNLTAGSGVQGSGSSNGDQTFTAKSDLKWRVLSIENGCVNLVSESYVMSDSDTEYILEGITGYQYGIKELNKICEIYGHGKGAKTARSINMEDVNKLAKYSPRDQYKNYGTEMGWAGTPRWLYSSYSFNIDPSRNNSWPVENQIIFDLLTADTMNTRMAYWLATSGLAGDSSCLEPGIFLTRDRKFFDN